jgi:hypothetical protein
VTEADALEIAELTVGCENLRAELDAAKLDGKSLKDKANLINSITRLQSTTARAKRALLRGVPDAAEADALREHREIMAKYLRPAQPEPTDDE